MAYGEGAGDSQRGMMTGIGEPPMLNAAADGMRVRSAALGAGLRDVPVSFAAQLELDRSEPAELAVYRAARSLKTLIIIEAWYAARKWRAATSSLHCSAADIYRSSIDIKR